MRMTGRADLAMLVVYIFSVYQKLLLCAPETEAHRNVVVFRAGVILSLWKDDTNWTFCTV